MPERSHVVGGTSLLVLCLLGLMLGGCARSSAPPDQPPALVFGEQPEPDLS